VTTSAPTLRAQHALRFFAGHAVSKNPYSRIEIRPSTMVAVFLRPQLNNCSFHRFSTETAFRYSRT
jgi:hypothetical protein